MRDIPIIFSSAMVRALLDGRKTMTRRLAWHDHGAVSIDYGRTLEAKGWRVERRDSTHSYALRPSAWQNVEIGDRLWVREGWKPHSIYAGVTPSQMPESKVFYLADNAYSPSNVRGVPSIHMPRWASRITLIVDGKKIEPLRDISEADAIAEGMAYVDHGFRGDGQLAEGWHHDPAQAALGSNFCFPSARDAFANLWRSLHGEQSWDSNPEIVAPSFKIIKANIDAPEARTE